MSYQIQKVNFLTNSEWVAITATMQAIEDRRYYCGDCLSKFSGRKDEESMLQKARESKNCFGKPGPYIHHLDDMSFSKCIGNYFDSTVASLLGANELYQKGVMPFNGSLFDQPAKIIETFSVIESIKRDTQLKAQEAERAKQKRGR